MKDRFREWVDYFDKAAIGIGAVFFVASPMFPAFLMPSILLITGGAVSLGITQAVWPKKQNTA
jgi:hypothetical protein